MSTVRSGYVLSMWVLGGCSRKARVSYLPGVTWPVAVGGDMFINNIAGCQKLQECYFSGCQGTHSSNRPSLFTALRSCSTSASSFLYVANDCKLGPRVRAGWLNRSIPPGSDGVGLLIPSPRKGRGAQPAAGIWSYGCADTCMDVGAAIITSCWYIRVVST